MAVTNDGFGNYFSGSNAIALPQNEVQNDIESILTTLGLTFRRGTGNGICVFSGRFAGETLTGSLGSTPTSPLYSITNAADQSRWMINIGSGLGPFTTYVPFILNSSSTNTEVTCRGITTSYNPSDWNDNVFSSSTGWAVVNNKSISYFLIKDTNNYGFCSVGEFSNLGAYEHPLSIYGLFIGKYQGTKFIDFKSIKLNNTTGELLHTKGSEANYIHTPISGDPAPSAAFLGRRVDNDYGIGNVPNIIKVKSTESLTIGSFPVGLNNITQSNANIIGSTNNTFVVVGRLDDEATNDDAGDYLLMRIKTL